MPDKKEDIEEIKHLAIKCQLPMINELLSSLRALREIEVHKAKCDEVIERILDNL